MSFKLMHCARVFMFTSELSLSLSLYMIYGTLNPVISRPKSEAKFSGPTRFSGQFQSFDPQMGDIMRCLTLFEVLCKFVSNTF